MPNPGETIRQNLRDLEARVLRLLLDFENTNGVKITSVEYLDNANPMHLDTNKPLVHIRINLLSK